MPALVKLRWRADASNARSALSGISLFKSAPRKTYDWHQFIPFFLTRKLIYFGANNLRDAFFLRDLKDPMILLMPE
jgi:hypothetical protein